MFFSIHIIHEFTNSDVKFSYGIIGLFFIISLPALFFAKEARDRRRDHNELRKIALGMKILDGYISDLKPDERYEIKKSIAEQIFSGSQTGNDNSGQGLSVSQLSEVIKLIQKNDKSSS